MPRKGAADGCADLGKGLEVTHESSPLDSV